LTKIDVCSFMSFGNNTAYTLLCSMPSFRSGHCVYTDHANENVGGGIGHCKDGLGTMCISTTEERNPSTVDLVEVELSPNALTVLEKRYLKKDKNGQVIETPEEMFWRVAQGLLSARH
jgi:hypothetical protein